jgi:hypothetical protein
MTRPAFLVFVSVRTLAAAAALLALSAALASCGDAEEDLAPDPASATPSASLAPAATQTPVSTSAAPPEGWVEYTNKDLGFSLYHPPRLVPRDVSSTGGPNPQWVIDFRDPADASYAISVVIVENREGLSLAEWARTNVCDAEGPQKGGEPIEIAGLDGLFCWMAAMDDKYDRHVIFAQGARMIDLQSTQAVAEGDFQQAVRFFQLIPQGSGD